MKRLILSVKRMTWLPYLAVELKIRELLAERMERGATEQLDRRLWALIEERERVEQAGWFS